MFTFGSATAGLILAPLMAAVADAYSWRTAWLLMGLLVWSIAPLAWVTVRHRPEDLGLEPDGGAGPAIDAAAEARSQADLQAVEAYWTVPLALRSRSFWLLTLGFMLVMLPASSIFIHMSAFVQSKGYPVEAGAAAVSVYGFGAVLGRFVWGFFVAKLGLYRAVILWALLYGVSILLYTTPTSLAAIYGTSVLLGISIAGNQQLRAQTYPDYFGRKIVGALLGYSGIIATIAGASSPLIAALVFDQTGSYVTTFTLFGVCCLLASGGFLFSKPRRPVVAPEAVEAM
jgi:sugar phosphate permease